MKQLTKKEAIAIGESKVWEKWTDGQIVRFQLYQECLAIPFSRFHEAVEKVFSRPVWTHEFADVDQLRAEYEKRIPAPTFQEIIELIPIEKRMLVLIP